MSSQDFEQCKSPWLISSLADWIKACSSEGSFNFSDLSNALIGLFTHTIPTLGFVAAERITLPLLDSLTKQGFLSVDKVSGLVIINSEVEPSGVLPMITLKGCYSHKVHDYKDNDDLHSSRYRCYSSRCWKTLPYKTILPNLERAMAMDDSDRLNWTKVWGISDEELANLDKKVIERQSAIHELIATEDSYVRGLKVFLNVFGNSFLQNRNILSNATKFYETTFKSVTGLIDSNDTKFLSFLKARQSQQGPYIDCIGDLILNWLKTAKDPYIIRAKTYPFSSQVYLSEKKKNIAFVSWLGSVEQGPNVSKQQKFDILNSSPFTRLCRYNLLFDRIKKSTPEGHPDHELLERCKQECESILTDYNLISGEAIDLHKILTLEERIEFGNNEETKVELRLTEGRRKLVHEGDVLRKGELKIDFVDTHLILLDHYLIIAKIRKDNPDKYFVTKKVSCFFYFSFCF